jgi:MoaA/NifB/PqqE/SkfB family radical SAM enzyme
MTGPVAPITIDIELTNRCNSLCGFCPRDAIPEQGFMRANVFEQSLARALEFQSLAKGLPSPLDATIVFCGTGEPLVHCRTAQYVRRVRDAGLACELSTNGSLLSRDRAIALLEAGLQSINVNVSDLGADYDEVYGIPFTRTRENVERFIALARGRCVVSVIVVDHRHDESHLRAVEAYWRARGVDNVLRYGLVNRGGSLRLAAAAVRAPDPGDRSGEPALRLICPVPFVHLFIGWDGRYYLCSHDWRKEVPFGSVFETSFAEITAAKLAQVSRRKLLCVRCTLDPANLLRRRRQVADPTLSRPLGASVEDLVFSDAVARELARQVMAAAPNAAPGPASRTAGLRALRWFGSRLSSRI